MQLKAEVAQAALDSLNIQKKKITAMVDSLTARAIIAVVFGNLDSLEYANVLKQYNMITANNYYDGRLNPDGAGIENDFEVQLVEEDRVIYDATTSLTWQATTELPRLNWERAQAYVDTLTHAGFDDWRLPTLEEAMSLMEPKKNEHGLYIDPIFDRKQRWIWTADKYSASGAWVVSFRVGICTDGDMDNHLYVVRAVR